jgi:hypothetical protein
MQKIIFIIIFSILYCHQGYAQNQFVTKIQVPQKAAVNSLKLTATPSLYQALPKTVYAAQPLNTPLLHFNDSPVLKFAKTAAKPVLLFTEFSFSDLFENSMNGIKADLINTYDDHLPELFNEAPSTFKVKCIIPL